MIAPSSQLQTGSVHSELVIFPSRERQKIVAYLDFAPGGTTAPFVVMAPKYGETKKNNLQLAYYLAMNGVNVLRFDHTNHVGESEGEMNQFTLPGAVQDILAAFDYLEQIHGAKRAGLVANSLSCRMAVRVAAVDPRVAYLINLVGVVNVQRTLTIVYQEDVVAHHLAGKRWGINDVLGFDIDFERFLGALVASGLHTLEGTCADLEQIAVPVAFLAAQNDAWVDPEDVKQAAGHARQGQLIPIKDSMHEVRENPEAAEKTFRLLVQLCLGWAHGRPIAAADVVVPEKRSFLRQNKLERDRLRRANPDPQTETEFWSQYLDKYEFFESVDVYQYYLNLVGDLFGEIRSGEILLDAGCGNGLFGVWVLRQLLAAHQPPLQPPPVYVGVDLTHQGLLDAMRKHGGLRGDLVARKDGRRPDLGLIYARIDLDHFGRGAAEPAREDAAGDDGGFKPVVEFAPGTFDKICCSLLLSYLQRPEALLRELHRVLRPGGTIVVSSMKPFCDLSVIYRRYAEGQHTAQEIESARDLLRAAGKIKVKEELGYYVFYSAEELFQMMTAAGFVRLQTFASFGNQAVVVRAEK
jgi:SAM-dependent methyltransferase/dienelactone hydrolase